MKWTEEDMATVEQLVTKRWAEIEDETELHALRFGEEDLVGIVTKEKTDEYGMSDSNGEYYYSIFWILPKHRKGKVSISMSDMEEGLDSGDQRNIGSIDEYEADKAVMELEYGHVYRDFPVPTEVL